MLRRHCNRWCEIPQLGNSFRPFSATSLALAQLLQYKLTDIGEGTLKAILTEWCVDIGSTVKPMDKICEVESDKAAVPIPIPYHGVIKKLYANKGEEIYVGKPLVDIEVEGEGQAAEKKVDGPKRPKWQRKGPVRTQK